MEVQSSSEYIRAGKTLETQVGAISAASDRLDFGLDSSHFHRFDRFFHNVVVRLDLLAHVVILVLHSGSGGSLTIFQINEITTFLNGSLLPFKQRPVMVTDDIRDVRILYGTSETDDVEEALVTFCELRPLLYRQQGVHLHADKDGVFDHLEISKELPAEIVEEDLWVVKGDKVEGFEGANNAIGTLVLKFQTAEELEKAITNQRSWLKVVESNRQLL